MPGEYSGDTKEGTQGVPSVVQISLGSMLFKEPSENTLTVLGSFSAESVDHVITDPPYAIDMDNFTQTQGGQNIEDVRKEHDVLANIDLLDAFIPEAFRVMKPRGYFVMWCDPTHWWNLCLLAQAAGFTIQRWPLIWLKTSTCSNQAAQVNWTKNVEFALVARKGVGTLIRQQPSCVWTGGNDIETKLLGNPFAKPFGLWKWIYDAVTVPGQTVLDPFVGSGSAFIPAVKGKLRPLGIEANETQYGRLVVNVQNTFRSLDPNCQFI